MDAEEEKIRKQMEREEQITRRSVPKRLRLAAKLSTRSRAKNERRKYLAGSWALDRAERDPEFAAMMRQGLDRVWLVRVDDRGLWDLPPMPDDEKQERLASFACASRSSSLRPISTAPLTG